VDDLSGESVWVVEDIFGVRVEAEVRFGAESGLVVIWVGTGCVFSAWFVGAPDDGSWTVACCCLAF